MPQLVFHGTLIHSPELDQLAILENAVLVVDAEGRIVVLKEDVSRDEVPSLLRTLKLDDGHAKIRYLPRTEFLIPGFVDTHNHAPQYAQVRNSPVTIRTCDYMPLPVFSWGVLFVLARLANDLDQSPC